MACKEDHCRLLGDEDEFSGSDHGLAQKAQHQPLFYKRYAFISSALLALSVLLNAILFFPRHTPFMAVSYHDRSRYANLEVDTTLTWQEVTEYSSDNMTLTDERWKALSADDGIVAVDQEWAAREGLPPSENVFPWDSSKRIYLLNGYHGIHCLAQLHLTLREYRDGLPQSHSFEHSNHCLDWLRGDTMCRADDTPLYTTRSMVPVNGIGQSRQCRDWGKLESWARTHHSCYRYGDFVVEDKLPSQMGRFKYCPSDSPYLPAVRKYFGKGDDWLPVDP